MRRLLQRLGSIALLAALLLAGIENAATMARSVRLRLGFPGTEALASPDVPLALLCLTFFLLGVAATALWNGARRGQAVCSRQPVPRDRQGEPAP